MNITSHAYLNVDKTRDTLLRSYIQPSHNRLSSCQTETRITMEPL